MRIYPELDPTRIRPLNVHHETSAALMAYGYARVSGRPGVITLNRPGTMNVVMGLAEAMKSSVPIIVLMDGLVASSEGRHAVYEQDQIGIVKPVSKWIGDVHDLSRAPEMLRRAFQIATTGRPGPVVLNIRGVGSVFAPNQYIDDTPFADLEYASFPAARIPPDPQMIDRVLDLIRRHERVCIVAGGGVNLSRAWQELRELAELGQFPVATTISGKGAFPEKHSLSAGVTGRFVGGRLGRGRVADSIVKNSDLVLLVGSRTNEMATSRWTVPDPKSAIVHIDVDPQEIGRNYPQSVGIVADAKLALKAVAEALAAAKFKPKLARDAEIKNLLEKWRADNEQGTNSKAIPIHPARLMREVGEFLDPDTLLVADASNPFRWATSHALVEAGPTFITPRGTGAIGTGLPVAIGAKLAAPGKRVICFEGDGGIMCGILAELEMAARYNIAIVVVVFNNGSYLLEKQHLKGYDLSKEMNFLPGLNFANIAREFGCQAFRVEKPEAIKPALEKSLASDKPTLIDVVLDPEESFPAD